MRIKNLLSFQNKASRRKQRGIKSALQTVGFQPAFAPRSEELNPEEIKRDLYKIQRISKFVTISYFFVCGRISFSNFLAEIMRTITFIDDYRLRRRISPVIASAQALPLIAEPVGSMLFSVPHPVADIASPAAVHELSNLGVKYLEVRLSGLCF